MSRGIRIYWHDRTRLDVLYKRTRECYNYWAGQEQVEDILSDRTAKILAIGTEEGAMVLHYCRV